MFHQENDGGLTRTSAYQGRSNAPQLYSYCWTFVPSLVNCPLSCGVTGLTGHLQFASFGIFQKTKLVMGAGEWGWCPVLGEFMLTSDRLDYNLHFFPNLICRV